MQPQVVQSAYKHLDEGRGEQARSILQRALQKSPRDLEINMAMALVLERLGQFGQAVYYAERASESQPRNANVLFNLGNLRLAAGQTEAGLEEYRAALAADPGHKSAAVGETDALNRLWRLSESIERARAGLERHPREPALLSNCTAAMLQMGRAREAAEMLREAVEWHPDRIPLVSGLAGTLNYVGGVTREDLFLAHQRFGLLLRRLIPEMLPPARVDRDPDRRLRVGVLSSDLRGHAVSLFADPLFALGEGFEVHGYATHPVRDAVTERFRDRARGWRHVPMLGHAALATMIRSDRIDIVVELSGLTTGNRLPTLRLRPSPIQVTAVGYPATTGLEEIDYRVVDSVIEPPGSERWSTERPLRVDPCFTAYRPHADAPPARAWGPGERVVFGSFSALAKLDDEAVGMWTAVLRASPGSRLLLKALAFADAGARSLTMERLARAGGGDGPPLDPSRLELLAPTGTITDHLRLYDRVDIALDTFPYHGTTTTCEALQMGVPVVTRLGETPAAGVGASLLRAAGLGELVAESSEEFVRIAAGLANDPGRLAGVREGLRDRFLASPVCDADGMGTRLGAGLRAAWREFCTRA